HENSEVQLTPFTQFACRHSIPMAFTYNILIAAVARLIYYAMLSASLRHHRQGYDHEIFWAYEALSFATVLVPAVIRSLFLHLRVKHTPAHQAKEWGIFTETLLPVTLIRLANFTLRWFTDICAWKVYQNYWPKDEVYYLECCWDNPQYLSPKMLS